MSHHTAGRSTRCISRNGPITASPLIESRLSVGSSAGRADCLQPKTNASLVSDFHNLVVKVEAKLVRLPHVEPITFLASVFSNELRSIAVSESYVSSTARSEWNDVLT